MAEETARIITVPLKAAKNVPRTRRANRDVKAASSFIARHMKADEDKVWIDMPVSEKIWERGIQNPPSKITVKAVKFDDGLVEVTLPEEKE